MRRVVSVVLAVAGVLVGVAASPSAPAAEANAEAVAGAAELRAAAGTGRSVRVIARLKGAAAGGPAAPAGASSTLSALTTRMAAVGVAGVERLGSLPLVVLEVDAGQLEALLASGLVESVHADRLLRPNLARSVPLVDAPEAWARGADGTGQAVAVFDTGVDGSHPMLRGKVVAEACFSTNARGQRASSLCPGGAARRTGTGAARPCPANVDDGCFHGTHVAAIAAGKSSGASGVAPGAKVVAVQVFTRVDDPATCSPSSAPCVLAYSSDIIAGLDYVRGLAGTRKVAAANLSLGGGRYTRACDGEPIKDAVDALRDQGVATVIASGNDGYDGAVSYPGCVSTAITVGASTDGGPEEVAYFSNSSPLVDLLAPGETIRSAAPGGGFRTESGTSMATPHVAGAWAVLKSARGGASVSAVEQAFESTGRRLRDAGAGVTRPRLDVDDALQALRAARAAGGAAPAS